MIIHGRWSGWLKDLGCSVGVMVGGWAMLWTYYGVNFFQTGLHSYAGAGAAASIPSWLWIFTAVESGLLAAVGLRWRARRNTTGGSRDAVGMVTSS